MECHKKFKEWGRFLGVGGVAAATNWLLRLLLSLWMPFSLALLLAYFGGMLLAFSLNLLYVFPGTPKGRATCFRDFFLTNLFSLLLVWVGGLFFLRYLPCLGITHSVEALAHGLALLLPTCSAFFAYKFWVFRKKEIP